MKGAINVAHRHSTRTNMDKLGVIGVTLVAANVILLVALTGVVMHRHTDRQRSRDFIPVSPYSLNTSEFIDSTVTSSTEETSTVENLYLSVAHIYNTTGNQGKAAAHVFINSSSSYTGDDESTLTWRQDMDAAFVSDKISYKDGGLTVKEGGYYYIYSQIVYSGSGTQELDYGRIIHAVVKQKASELEEAPTPLMRNLQSTPSIRRGRPAYTTSSLGATFYLEAHTRVKVMSSVPGNIIYSPCSSYFGLYLV
ncbi:lymphotoxin-alpha-like isoform X1 [Haliotis rufescens]|uniref:lymphotoxin-alpha-like isoform X1 n=2 Tax=Haliotis rufescens TaxID=6454 RepID=UPI00201F4B52|nr:lymphotoxin-alpha-like isoform X1 [Haliotis rufescens]